MPEYQSRTDGNGDPLFAYELFADQPGVICRTTGRLKPAGDDGPAPFNLSIRGGPNRSLAADRRRALCVSLGLDFAELTCAEQVHGNRVAPVTAENRGAGGADAATAIRGADGLITNLADTPLLSLSADCCPLAIYDPVRRAVAAVHAGRKSTAGHIAEMTVAAMTAAYGSRPADLLAVVGPSIGPCCYQVGAEIRAEFPDDPDLFVARNASLHLDLWSANRRQLLAAGLRPGHIAVSGVCTGCHTDLFFSYRKEGTGCGLFGTLIALR